MHRGRYARGGRSSPDYRPGRWPHAAARIVTRHREGRGGQTMVEDEGMIGDRWGVSRSETLRAYPCDDFVTSPTLRAWRACTSRRPGCGVGMSRPGADCTVLLRLDRQPRPPLTPGTG